ncbi:MULTISPECIES: hypothetical protein [unclassified Streptomyces]|uniref:hypothetical protein n=1 Tax=unclassified Streptomyces TaxID=2593676 RepID=UPI0037F87C5B
MADGNVRDLVGRLGAGEVLAAVEPSVVLRGGESQFTDIVVGCHAYYGTSVEYSSGYAVQGGVLFTAFGIVTGEMHNAKVRREAEKMAALQWRWEGDVRVVLTDQRLIGFFGTGVEEYPMQRLVAVTPSPDGRAVSLSFDRLTPLLFSGDWAPWLCVLVSALAHRSVWPPGHTLPPFATPEVTAPPASPALAAPPAPPALAAPPAPPAALPPGRGRQSGAARALPAEVSAAERLAEEVDPLPADEAAARLAGHPASLVAQVLDLLGTRRAREIRAASSRNTEGRTGPAKQTGQTGQSSP